LKEASNDERQPFVSCIQDTESNDYYEGDKDLAPVLRNASNEELQPLVDYILNDANSRLEINPSYKKHNPDHRKYLPLIESEILSYGGNTFKNAYGKKFPSYHEVACNVAKKIDASYDRDWPIEKIEEAILSKIENKDFEKMNNKKKLAHLKKLGLRTSPGDLTKDTPLFSFKGLIERAGFILFKIFLFFFNVFAKFFLVKKLYLPPEDSLIRLMALLCPPFGWIYLAFDLSGPSYRVTIPSVYHIAKLRMKNVFTICDSSIEPSAKDAQIVKINNKT
jgi:uncharacterized protein YaaW (UPF0174 family)